jgi:hypothetical protein
MSRELPTKENSSFIVVDVESEDDLDISAFN